MWEDLAVDCCPLVIAADIQRLTNKANLDQVVKAALMGSECHREKRLPNPLIDGAACLPLMQMPNYLGLHQATRCGKAGTDLGKDMKDY